MLRTRREFYINSVKENAKNTIERIEKTYTRLPALKRKELSSCDTSSPFLDPLNDDGNDLTDPTKDSDGAGTTDVNKSSEDICDLSKLRKELRITRKMMSLVDYNKEIKSFQHDDSLSSIENLSKLSIFNNFQDVHSKIRMNSILTLMTHRPIEVEIAKMLGDINLHIKFPSHESYLMYARYLLLSLHIFIEYEYFINFEKTPTYLLHSVDLPEVPTMGAASFSGKPQSKSSFVFASPINCGGN
ncbi:unnamed protein product [Ambrosiozyma monospora]|uniref:Unnamed protein product n=1 Tax=Ambrosiozyma monospora TaxID=43982 RepID=A0A9W6WK90_AMBMO|nr:unnamed protein product [Ambrosiozyma monospora]